MRAEDSLLGREDGGDRSALEERVAEHQLDEQAAARLKHELRRSAIVSARVREMIIKLAHIPDATQYVDFFTKWVSERKVEASLAVLTGSLARAAHADAATVQSLNAAIANVMAMIAGWEAICEIAEAASA